MVGVTGSPWAFTLATPRRCCRLDVTPKDLERRAATKTAMRRLELEAVAIVTCPAASNNWD